jgi:hypothetical protein
MATPFTGHELHGKYSTLKGNDINEQIDKDLKEQIKYINDATSNVPYTIVASNIYLLKDKFSLTEQRLTDFIYSNTDKTKITPLIDEINVKIRRSNEFRQEEEEDKELELPPTPTSTSTSRSNSVATTNESISSDSTPTTSSEPPARRKLFGLFGGKSKKSRNSRKSRRSRKSKRSRKTRRGRK